MPRVFHNRRKTAWTEFTIEESQNGLMSQKLSETTRSFSRQSSGSTAASESDFGCISTPHDSIRLMSMSKEKPDAEKLSSLVRKMVFMAAGSKDGRRLPEILEGQDFQGWTLLLAAIQTRQDSVVRSLLELGADPNCRDPQSGWTALMYAVALCNESTVQLLLDSGAILDEFASPQSWNPLCVAIFSGRWDMVQFLLDAGADLNKATRRHPTMKEMYHNELLALRCHSNGKEDSKSTTRAATWVKDYDLYC
mmetsp:Transcript_26617/g.58454  ORF Transcript_26617/g.58454 Transcript_26617/m.58454 type:complete len:251 (-) Transcript_26617:115-867(-)